MNIKINFKTISIITLLLVNNNFSQFLFTTKIKNYPNHHLSISLKDTTNEDSTYFPVLKGPEINVLGKFPTGFQPEVLPERYFRFGNPVGESDVLRSVATLSGLVVPSDWQAMPSIRGLPPYFTSLFLDEVPILNPFHVGGFVGNLDAGIIDSIEVYRGITPLEYNNIGSGVILTRPKFLEKNRMEIEVGLISFNFRLFRNSPTLGKYNVSLRTFTLSFLNKLLDSSDEKQYSFYDGYLNYQKRFLKDLSLNFSTYYSREYYPEAAHGPRYGPYQDPVITSPFWENWLTSLKFQFKRLKLLLYYSTAPIHLQTTDNLVNNQLSEAGTRFVVSYPFLKGLFKSGVSLQRYAFAYQWNITNYQSARTDIPLSELFFDNAPDSFQYKSSVSLGAVFHEMEWDVLHKWRVSAGLRLNAYQFQNTYHFYSEPVFSISYSNTTCQLSGTYALTNRFLVTKRSKNYTYLTQPFMLYFPIANEPVRIHNIELQYENFLYRFRVTPFLRFAFNLPFYDWQTFQNYNTINKIYGLDFSWNIKKTVWALSMHYSFIRSWVYWRDQWIVSSQDRPHQLHVNYERRLLWDMFMSAQFTYITGSPYTEVTGWGTAPWPKIYHEPVPFQYVPLFENPNNQRLPVYHRLDVSFSRQFKVKKMQIKIIAGVYNVFNRRNLAFYVWKSNGTKEAFYNFPRLPFINLRFIF